MMRKTLRELDLPTDRNVAELLEQYERAIDLLQRYARTHRYGPCDDCGLMREALHFLAEVEE